MRAYELHPKDNFEALTLVDRETIVATTPEHAAGISNVRLFCGAQEIVAERAFEFVGPRRRSVRR